VSRQEAIRGSVAQKLELVEPHSDPVYEAASSGNFLCMTKPLLIVIDMLRDFLESWEPARKQVLVHSINELVGIARSFSRPVIWVRQEFEPDLRDAFQEMRTKGIRITIKGTKGCEILSELLLDPSDIVIVKKRYSAFYGTTLDEILAQLAPGAIILAGINTHACVRTTAIDAYRRDWPVVLAADCIDSYDQQHHEISLRYMKDKVAAVMSNEEIRSSLLSHPPPSGSI
jgi:nicotinamidase-related amidase